LLIRGQCVVFDEERTGRQAEAGVKTTNESVGGEMAKFLAALLVLSGLGTSLVAADVSGAWKLFLDPDLGGVRNTVPCTFTQDRQKLTIICNGDTAAPRDGKFEAKKQ
jgi:hypothetical protein